MRVVAILAACAMLGGCEAVSTPANPPPKAADPAGDAPDAAFDYRYAFRLPASRIEAVQESHARGCDQLGPARCRITAMRYTVGPDDGIAAVLTLKLDPMLARAYGKAASQTVSAAHGTLTDAVVAGASGRGDGVLAHLRETLANSEAQLRAAPPEAQPQLSARIDRLRGAIATIGEVDQAGAAGTASTPMLFRYSSGSALPGIGASPEATFDTAGDTFLASLASLLVILAGIGPWIVLLLGGALALRWILARTDAAVAPDLPPAPREEHDPSRTVIQRWFNRDETKEHEAIN